MEKSFLLSLAHYNFYADGILLEMAAKIPYETLESTASPSRHSALTLLKHTVETEAFFLAQLLGEEYQPRVKSLTSMAEIQAYARRTGENFLSYVNGLDASALEQVVEVGFGGYRLPVWQVLTQVFMHAAQHRGELSILLSSIGYPLPLDDIIVKFVEESGQVWH